MPESKEFKDFKSWNGKEVTLDKDDKKYKAKAWIWDASQNNIWEFVEVDNDQKDAKPLDTNDIFEKYPEKMRVLNDYLESEIPYFIQIGAEETKPKQLLDLQAFNAVIGDDIETFKYYKKTFKKITVGTFLHVKFALFDNSSYSKRFAKFWDGEVVLDHNGATITSHVPTPKNKPRRGLRVEEQPLALQEEKKKGEAWKQMISEGKENPYKTITVQRNGNETVRRGKRSIARWDSAKVSKALRKDLQELKDELSKFEFDPAVYYDANHTPQPQTIKLRRGHQSKFDNNTFPFEKRHVKAGFKHVVSMKDFYRFLENGGENWLALDGIDFYLELMNRRNQLMLKTKGYQGPLLNCYFFHMDFYNLLYKNNKTYSFMNEFGKGNRAHERGDVFDERDMLMMLINPNENHWTLLVVNFKDKRIEYFDGFGKDGTEYIKNMHRWLHDEHVRLYQERWEDEKWTYHNWTEVQGRPTQEDVFNCGVIALQTANYYVQQGKLDFKKDDWVNFRTMMVAEILDGRLYDGDGFLQLPEKSGLAGTEAASATTVNNGDDEVMEVPSR